MANSGQGKASFLDLLTSPLTLGPAVLGVSAAIVFWAMEWEEGYVYLAGGGGLAVALAMFVTLFFVKGGIGPSSSVNRQARDDLLANLESLGRSLQRRGATESTSAGTVASVEK